MKERRDKYGFTIVELLIVIGVMLTIGGMSVYAVTQFLREDRLVIEGQKIELWMRQQREQARALRQDRRVIFDFVRRSLRVYSAGIDNAFGSFSNPGDDVFEEEFFLDKGMSFERAVIKASDYQGGAAYFPELSGGEPPTAFSHANYETGAIVFKRSGKIDMEKYTPLTGAATDSLSFDVSTSDWETDKNADIIIISRGEPKRLLIDVRSLGGQVDSKVARLKTTP